MLEENGNNNNQEEFMNDVQLTPPVEMKKSKTAKVTASLTKLQIDVLQYFCNLPINRQVAMLEESEIDLVKIAEAVSKHRKAALEDVELAVEKMLAEQAPNRSGEKSALLETRYRVNIERFAAHGLTAAMIAKHLSEVERGNYPRRPKSWRFTPAIVGKFMKDNGIDVTRSE